MTTSANSPVRVMHVMNIRVPESVPYQLFTQLTAGRFPVRAVIFLAQPVDAMLPDPSLDVVEIGASSLLDIRALIRLRRELVRADIDVIHAHHGSTAAVIALLLPYRFRRGPDS